jgi:hypothetical protein
MPVTESAPAARGGVTGPICPRDRPRYRNHIRLCRRPDRHHPGFPRTFPGKETGFPSSVPRLERLPAPTCLLLRVPGRVRHRAFSPEAPAPFPGFEEGTP